MWDLESEASRVPIEGTSDGRETVTSEYVIEGPSLSRLGGVGFGRRPFLSEGLWFKPGALLPPLIVTELQFNAAPAHASCPGQAGTLRAAFKSRGVSGMSKNNKQKTKTAIYHPPKKGMPFLVVTVSPEGVVGTAVDPRMRLACSHQRKR